MLAPVLFSLLAINPPHGWVEDAAPDARVRVFHSPQDRHAEFFVSQLEDVGDPRSSVQHVIDHGLAEAHGQVETRTHREDESYAIGEAMLTLPDGAHQHLRVAASARGGHRVEIMEGSCIGSGAPFKECDEQLALINVGNPDVGFGNARRSLLWVAELVAVIAILALGIRWLLRFRAKERRVAFVDHELVTLTGVARPIDASVEAALSGRACIAYRSRARLFTGTSVPQLVGEPVEAANVPFIITTPMGDVRVEGTALEIELAPETIIEHARAREEAFLTRNGFETKLLENARFEEAVIESRKTIVISGMIAIARAPQPGETGYRDDAPAVVTLVAPHGKALRIKRSW